MIIFPERRKIATEDDYPRAILDTLDAFYKIASTAQWKTALEIKQTFPESDILRDGRIIFDIENQYHLVIQFNPPFRAIYVQFLVPYGKLTQILSTNSYR